jgi:hypothetical protein
MPPVRRVGAAVNVLRWSVPPICAGLAPVATIIGANFGMVPLRSAVIARSILVAAAVVVLVLAALRVLQRDLPARASWLTWFLLLFNLYGASAEGLRQLGLSIWPWDPFFAVPYVLTSGVIAAIAAKPWEVRPRASLPLTVAAALFLGVALLPAAEEERWADPSWRGAADALVTSALSQAPPAGFMPDHDIYYIVLDALGGADMLHRNYRLDLRPVVAALEQRGFYVVPHARSNYSQTYLSLASTLNMAYLDELAAHLGPAQTTRDPLGYLIQENALMRMASRAGYRIVAVGSDYVAAREFDQADQCLCRLDGLDEVEIAAMGLTPLAAVPLTLPSGDAYDMHRRKVTEAFEILETFQRGPRRTFVFAHVLAPHPPFVLRRDGTPVRPDRTFSLADWRAFEGTREEYVEGYAEQARFILERTLEVVDAILAQPGPPPAIVIHGDHGPGATFRFDDGSDAGIRERMEIFAAYYFPDRDGGLYPTMTPVNGARLLARHYLGAALRPLPDRVVFSTGERPYHFVPLP